MGRKRQDGDSYKTAQEAIDEIVSSAETSAELVVGMKKCAALRDHSDAARRALESRILRLQEKDDVPTKFAVDSGGVRYNVTRVPGRRQELLNEARLRKKVGAAIWNKITTRVLDSKKLAQARKEGVIDDTVIAECMELGDETRTYLRVTSPRS